MENLENEVQKQAELRVMYKKRMERTQDYLRYCLQVAQENGILDLIVHYKGELQQQSPLSASTVSSIASPRIPTPAHHHPDLAAIINQAETNGWCIDPTEVSIGYSTLISTPSIFNSLFNDKHTMHHSCYV